MARGGGTLFGTLYMMCKELLEIDPNLINTSNDAASMIVGKELRRAYGKKGDMSGVRGFYTPIGYPDLSYDSVFITVGSELAKMFDEVLIETPAANGAIIRERVAVINLDDNFSNFSLTHNMRKTLRDLMEVVSIITSDIRRNTSFKDSLYYKVSKMAPVYIVFAALKPYFKWFTAMDDDVYQAFRYYLIGVYCTSYPNNDEYYRKIFDNLCANDLSSYETFNAQHIYSIMTMQGSLY